MIIERVTIKNVIESIAREDAKAFYDSEYNKNPNRNVSISALDIKVPLPALVAFYEFLDTDEPSLEIDVSDWDEECISDYLFKDYLWLANLLIKKSLIKQLGLYVKEGEWFLSEALRPQEQEPQKTKDYQAPLLAQELVAKPPEQEPLESPMIVNISGVYALEIKNSYSIKNSKLFKGSNEFTKDRATIEGRAFPTRAIKRFLEGKPVDLGFLFERKGNEWYRSRDPYWTIQHVGTKVNGAVKICGKSIDLCKGTQEDI